MSAPNSSAPSGSSAIFTKGFIPGLIVGLVVGLAVGVFMPALLGPSTTLKPIPNPPKKTERDAFPETPTDPAKPGDPAKPADPSKPTDPKPVDPKPATPGTDKPKP